MRWLIFFRNKFDLSIANFLSLKKKMMLQNILVVIALAIAINKLAKENKTNLKTAIELIRSCSQLISKATRFMLSWGFVELVSNLDLILAIKSLFS
ncbi:hypothetical protein DS957_003935 [Vibrio harveyi]|uniref:Uncharacterized protein n=1 Tax=Vibrio harveyi TaxID=669 RepID=A0A8B3DTA8_VIBHA|nr:hypothetical protein DS957_003935 [Vibrio harveyi]